MGILWLQRPLVYIFRVYCVKTIGTINSSYALNCIHQQILLNALLITSHLVLFHPGNCKRLFYLNKFVNFWKEIILLVLKDKTNYKSCGIARQTTVISAINLKVRDVYCICNSSYYISYTYVSMYACFPSSHAIANVHTLSLKYSMITDNLKL